MRRILPNCWSLEVWPRWFVTEKTKPDRTNDDLLVAESKAIQQKKGVHSPKDAPIPHDLNDASENVKKATQFLPFLQRAGKFHGVVEHCINGHRFRVSSQNAGAVIHVEFIWGAMPDQGRTICERGVKLRPK